MIKADNRGTEVRVSCCQCFARGTVPETAQDLCKWDLLGSLQARGIVEGERSCGGADPWLECHRAVLNHPCQLSGVQA